MDFLDFLVHFLMWALNLSFSKEVTKSLKNLPLHCPYLCKGEGRNLQINFAAGVS